ncbi:Sodium/proton antiporter ChaA [Corynebacterium occultum]|uniref:Sodium/proton antiporter ChaA n=1 Tax=Corynebacterium occultum TaxID=2675219 RepID=A0A6B8W8H9_9CORY|nr:calcium:proton antiporter [Corynebacterium occultum]QGU06300.1 Sodium/proton antiporter ChaA [Corynebacterium occultum]
MSSPVPPFRVTPARPLLLSALFTPSVWARLLLGWGAFLLLGLFSSPLAGSLPAPVVWGLLGGIILVILICAFGVMEQAEGLARRLGDPYGTLVLTLSVVGIEVILISAVLLGPGDHATIARDSIMAVSMIILNLVLGLALLIGGVRHGDLAHNRAGTSAYLSLLVLLSFLAFALPSWIGEGGAFTTAQAVPVILLTVVLYAFFLYRQMGAQKTDFQEPELLATASQRPPVTQVITEHRSEVFGRFALLLAMVFPIVLLSHTMAALLDVALGRLGAPVALSGIIIAAIVFLPETITTLRAALGGEMQRVSNLTHGALVSTVGLSVPVVLLISLLTGRSVVFAESPVNLALLLVTLLMSVASFVGPKVGAVQGAAHLVLFVIYLLCVFS